MGALREPGEITICCKPFFTKISVSNAMLFLSDVIYFFSASKGREKNNKMIIAGILKTST